VKILNHRLRMVILLATGLLAMGTLGYVLIERWPWHDALFMTVITLSSVGYGEVHELSPAGEIFTIFLILLGVGGIAYTFTVIADYVVAGELNGILRRQRMQRAIKQMRNHYVVCGFGRVGQQVVTGLRESGQAVVAIDAHPELAVEFEQQGVSYVIGDAVEDKVLQEAGIEHARGLCTCLPNDATNVFVVLSARALNPKLTIISRCNLPENDRKLRIAGANQVINPYTITGHRMAAQLLHPSVVEFLDVIMRRGELELRIEEIVVSRASPLAQHTLAELRIRTETGVNVLAVRRQRGELLTDLHLDFTLHAGDALISLGTESQLATLSKLATTREA
jgi:voltage-gated potassium channel